MSDNENTSNNKLFSGLFVLMFVALFLFIGNKHINNNSVADVNNEKSEVIASDESNETIEVTAEKFVPNEDDAEDDVEEGIVITGSPPASEE